MDEYGTYVIDDELKAFYLLMLYFSEWSDYEMVRYRLCEKAGGCETKARKFGRW